MKQDQMSLLVFTGCKQHSLANFAGCLSQLAGAVEYTDCTSAEG